MKDKQSIKVRDSIAGCVWKTDEFDDPDMDALKIDSEVANDWVEAFIKEAHRPFLSSFVR